jgi:outer membrane immunogenic protein
MGHLFRRIALATTMLLPAAAMAADIDIPPPEDLRPATYDWTGAYVGAFVAGSSVDGHYDAAPLCACGGAGDPEMSGIGFNGGLLAGFNYQVDNFVFGIEGDWGFGGRQATNDDPGEATYLNYNDIATARARAGFADDRTLFYVAGGLAAVNAEFGGLVGPTAEDTSDSRWIYGWTIGGGIEHAFTNAFHARLEYLYVGLPDTDFSLINSAGVGGTVHQMNKDMQMVRAAMTYNFTW